MKLIKRKQNMLHNSGVMYYLLEEDYYNYCEEKGLTDIGQIKINIGGEFIWYDYNNQIIQHGFTRKGDFIGKYYSYGVYGFSSIREMKSISECEYKKELVLLRLGIIETPPEFSLLLKDY